MEASELCANLHKCTVYSLGMSAIIKEAQQLKATTEEFVQYLIEKTDFKSMLFIYMHIENWIKLSGSPYKESGSPPTF